MVVEAIYVVRHGYRMNWSVNVTTGNYSTGMPTPTGIASDPQLASHGEAQARELAEKIATLDPPVDAIYSSAFYRCLQTLKPTIEKLDKELPRPAGPWKVKVDRGIGEYFGLARFEHPAPASLTELEHHFNFLDPSSKSTIIPSSNGESLHGLHDRVAYALSQIIAQADADPSQPKALLLCTHAAAIICMGRALTGVMPEDPDTEDFRCGTCCLSKFVRRNPNEGNKDSKSQPEPEPLDSNRPNHIPVIPWRNGRGIGGGWDCTVNGDCSFLEQGEERTWNFHMEPQPKTQKPKYTMHTGM